jgi:glycosyltransferase involved in cell wall biosynthesis
VAAHQTGTKIIYTAHGFHFFQGAPLKNWLLYYPVERFLSRWTDMLICINHEDFDRAQRSFHAKRTVYVPGVGVDVDKFQRKEPNREQIRKQFGLDDSDIMLLSMGELNKNKNHEIAVRAIAKMCDQNIHYLIAGQDRSEGYLHRVIEQLKLEDQVQLLGFRDDIQQLCQCADIFVLPSLREGLSVSLMEAMASGLPCIVGRIRGNVELIEDGKGGYLCDPRDANEFAEKINALSNCEELRSRMGAYNREKIRGFDEEIINQRMKELYRTI